MRSELEKEYLLKAVDASNRIFFIISTDFTILAANSFTAAKYNHQLIGHKCHQVLCGSDTLCEDCAISIVLESKAPYLRKMQENGDGPQWSTCRYYYPIFEGGAVDAIAVLEFDRPSREEMEEKLQWSNAFLRNLILSSVDGVIAADKTGKILMFNDAAAEISGYDVEEALENLDIRDVYPGDGARDIMKKLRSEKYGGKGKLKSYQVDVLRKNEEIIPISLNASIVYEGEEEVASIGFFHDLREELRMKSELEKTQVQLLQAEKMSSLGKLSAGVAHQLNNPLGGITLYAKLMLEEHELPEEVREDLERILREAQRCRDTVKELLEFARQTSHMVRPHDINEALSRTLFLLENQSLFQNIEIQRSFDQSLPQVSLDIQQMNHVFMNIILNAAQAMSGKGVLTLSTTFSEDRKGVVITFADTGPGIAQEHLQHIFEPFFTTKEEGEGTGLGLSMAYGIVENHGGRVTVMSEPGKGTQFVIELPFQHGEGGEDGE